MTTAEAKSTYEIEVFEELPPAPPRQSKLVEVLDKVKELPHGKPVLIKKFDSAQKATGTANHLKVRWGSKPDAYGFSFKTRRIDDKHHGLFVIYEPHKIVEGAHHEVDKKYDEHRNKAAESQRKRIEKNKAEGKTVNQASKVPGKK